YFPVLGLQPALGRLIAPADTQTIGGTPVAVLSYDYWVTRFNRDMNVTSETVTVNGQTLSVIGVAPFGFDGTTRGTRAKVLVPISLRGKMEPPYTEFDARDNYWVYVFARLKPGVTMAAAETGINVPYHSFIANELPLQKGLGANDKTAFANKQIVLSDGR